MHAAAAPAAKRAKTGGALDGTLDYMLYGALSSKAQVHKDPTSAMGGERPEWQGRALTEVEHGEPLASKSTEKAKGATVTNSYCDICRRVVSGRYDMHCKSKPHRAQVALRAAGWRDGGKELVGARTLTGNPFESIPLMLTGKTLPPPPAGPPPPDEMGNIFARPPHLHQRDGQVAVSICSLPSLGSLFCEHSFQLAAPVDLSRQPRMKVVSSSSRKNQSGLMPR